MMIRDIVGFVALVFLLQPKGINAICKLEVYNDINFQGTKFNANPGIYWANKGDFSDDAVSSLKLTAETGDEICCAHFYDLDTDSLSGAIESQCVSEDASKIFKMEPDRTSKISLQDSVFLFPDNKVVSDQINDIHSDINENIDELDTEISNAVTTLGTCFCGNEIDNGKNEIINAIKNETNTNGEILNGIVDHVKNEMKTNGEILNAIVDHVKN
eukprot:508702_1